MAVILAKQIGHSSDFIKPLEIRRMEEFGKEEELLSSPRDRVLKFLCSHGGKILPRPSDGQLKYVGGDNRIIAVPATITFSELMNKLSSMFNGDVVLKYQLVPEDMDALISVTCDEDLKHMFDEFQLHEAVGCRDGRSARMRAFLFPSHISSNMDQWDSDIGHNLEQRYIEAINSITRTTSDLGPCADSICSSQSSENSAKGVGETCEVPTRGRYQELQRVNSSRPNLPCCSHQSNHQLYQQARPSRPGTPLMASRSEVGRYNIAQLVRKYYTPVFHSRGNGKFNGLGQTNRSSGVEDAGGLLPQSPVRRWGSPLKQSSARQD